jgi:hypothetical protein
MKPGSVGIVADSNLYSVGPIKSVLRKGYLNASDVKEMTSSPVTKL